MAKLAYVFEWAHGLSDNNPDPGGGDGGCVCVDLVTSAQTNVHKLRTLQRLVRGLVTRVEHAPGCMVTNA